MIKFIIQYWPQLLLVLSAIGFVIAKFIELNLKRKEIRYNFYYKEKIDLILRFYKCYNEFQNVIDNHFLDLRDKSVIHTRLFSLAEQLYEKLENLRIEFIVLTEKGEVALYNKILDNCKFFTESMSKHKEGDIKRLSEILKNDPLAFKIIDGNKEDIRMLFRKIGNKIRF